MRCEGNCDWITNPCCWLAWVGPFLLVGVLAAFTATEHAERVGTAVLQGFVGGWVARGLVKRYISRRAQ